MEKKTVRLNQNIHDLIKMRTISSHQTIEKEVNELLKQQLRKDGDLIDINED